MSSSFLTDDKHWLLCVNKTQRKLTTTEEALVLTTFDSETEMDILKIQKEMLETKYIKMECLYFTLLSIPGYFISFFIFSKKTRASKRSMNSLYRKFLRNKINLFEFKKELQQLQKQSRIE